MAKQTRTRPVSAAQARAYIAKAEEYLSAATAELDAGRPIAATSLSIHAGINAADVVTGFRLGVRAAGQDHDQTIGLLRTAGPDGVTVAKELGRLLAMKTRAEYEPDGIPRADAVKAVERTRRIVEVARRIESTQRSD